MNKRVLWLSALSIMLSESSFDPKRKFSGNVNQLKTGIRPKIQRGTKYTFPDGFECYAMNQKNADRKHNNFLAHKAD